MFGWERNLWKRLSWFSVQWNRGRHWRELSSGEIQDISNSVGGLGDQKPENWQSKSLCTVVFYLFLGMGVMVVLDRETADLINPTTCPLYCNTCRLCSPRKWVGVLASVRSDSLRCSEEGAWSKPTLGGASSFRDLPHLLCLAWFAQGHPWI